MKNQYEEIIKAINSSRGDHISNLINNIRDIASKNMSEMGFSMFDLLLCSYTTKESQELFIRDLYNRFEFAKNEKIKQISGDN